MTYAVPLAIAEPMLRSGPLPLHAAFEIRVDPFLVRSLFFGATADSIGALARRAVAWADLVRPLAKELDHGGQVAAAVRRLGQLPGCPAIGGGFIGSSLRNVAEL